MKNKVLIQLVALIPVLFFANISHGLFDGSIIDTGDVDLSKPFKDGGKYLSDRGKALQNAKPEDFDCLNKNSECRKGLRHLDEQRLDAIRDLVEDTAGPLCVENSEVVYDRNRSKSRNGLSELQYRYLEKYFGNIVDKVTFRWNSHLNDHITFQGRTLYQGSGAQTYGYNIYMKDKNFKNDIQQIVLMAHELQHVKQYENYGRSLSEYCGKYMSQWVEAGFSYDNIKMEREAFKVERNFESWIYNEEEKKYDKEGEDILGDDYDPSRNPYSDKSSFSRPTKIESPENIRRKLEEEKRIKEEKEEKERKERRRREVKKEMKQIDDEYSRLNSERKKNFSAPTVTPEMQSARERFEAFRNRNR
ncbi:MAG: hypothetical protein D3922_12395 [Candidatus Electrothrix sp. AR1]|nr:hypothetical protein [Candidatus Electrothrix sp. AR1]